MALPPGPRTPAVLNTLRLLRDPVAALRGWAERYGEPFTVRYLRFGTGVYVTDPAEIKRLFTGDQSDLLAGEANSPLAPLLGPDSLLTLDGEPHMRQRKLLLPPFSGSSVRSFRPVIREVAEAEIGRWRAGESFPVRERMQRLTFEVICRAVFGVTEAERIERLRAALLALLDVASVSLLPPPLLRDLGRFSPGGVLRRRLRAADALLYEEIERRRRAPDLEQRSDVLSLLLGARDEQGRPMRDSELRDELITMLAAGHETTATGLAFAFDLLLRNPAALARLREETDGGGGDAYLDAVVSETLRVRPVLDAAERTLTVSRTIAGYEIPAGVRVYPATLLVHSRPDLYPEPDRFRPERFLGDGVESYSWLPFGGGIRRCIGAPLAQAEMAEVLRIAFSRVELEPVRAEPDPVVIRGITLTPKHGTEVRVRRLLRGRARERTAALPA